MAASACNAASCAKGGDQTSRSIVGELANPPEIMKLEAEAEVEFELEPEPVLDQSWSSCKVYKNLFGISLSFFLIFGAYLAEISLQSSVNEDGGLGLVSLSVLYFTFFMCCLLSSAVINFFGTKYTIVIAYCGLTIYTASNFYSSWYTLIPGSVVAGVIFGSLWASQSVHIAQIAQLHANRVGKNLEHIVFRFFGIYVFIFKLSNVPANIISSVVLLNDRSPNTSFVVSSDKCNNTDAANSSIIYHHVLLSIYIVLDIIAIVMVVVLVDRIGTITKFLSMPKLFNHFVKAPIVNTLKLMVSWKMNVLVIIMILDGYALSFVTGLFTKVYVSDCIGVYWIGFCQAAFGSSSAVSAIVNGYLVKVIPQYLLFYIGVLVNSGTLIFLSIWERQPVHYILFIVVICLGYGEGLWNSVPPSLVSTVLSHKDKESAHSLCRMGMALGFIFGFVCAILLNAEVLIWIELGMIIIATICYSVLIFATQPIHRLLPCCCKEHEKVTQNDGQGL